MSKKRKQTSRHQQSARAEAMQVDNEQRPGRAYMRRGVVALGAGFVLLIIQLIFLFQYTHTSSPGDHSLAAALAPVAGLLIIDGVLLLIGLILLGYGLWLKRQERLSTHR